MATEGYHLQMRWLMCYTDNFIKLQKYGVPFGLVGVALGVMQRCPTSMHAPKPFTLKLNIE